MKKFLKFSFILLANFVIYGLCERAKDRIYTEITGASCFRRLNGTHQVGCSSKYSGSAGVIHVISSTSDIDFIVENPRSPPYAAVIPPHLFSRENILRLRDEGGKNVASIVLINKTDQLKKFTTELKCPNQYSGIKEQTCDASLPETLWNPYGTGLLHENFPFPIYYVADPFEIDKIISCFEKFNNFDKENQARRALCAIEINTFMSAAGNTETCIRRSETMVNLYPTKYCDPLEGRSIYATLFPRTHVDDVNSKSIDLKEKFILVSCRIDTTSMFEGVGLGAKDSLVPYATLISLSHMLAKILPKKNLNTNMENYNVLFMIFNGESFDYIGSQRFVYDLHNLTFPKKTHRNLISIEQIDFMIDLGTLDELNNIRLYTANKVKKADEFLEKLQIYNQRYDLKIGFSGPHETLNLPPTSAQSFLRENLTFPVVILNSKPKNLYYHSIYDDVENLQYKYMNRSIDFSQLMENNRAGSYYDYDSIQMKIRNTSSVIALALYGILTKTDYFDTNLSNPVLIDEFLYCFLESADCPLFKAASHPNSYPGLPLPPSRYISVLRSPQDSVVWTYRLLGYLLSQNQSEVSKENCTVLPLHWFAGFNGTGECRLTTQNYTKALSPAFLDSNYDWKSGKYSTWTESTWTPFSARIYLRPSRIHETVTLSIGFIVLVFSFVIVFLISTRSEVLFESIPVSVTRTEPAAC